MKRVLILGIPGAGKSTLAQRLGAILCLPVFHLDRYYWNPGWKATPPQEWADRQIDLLSRPEWIIDGNYRSSIPLRLQYADTVIYLDIPRRLALWRIMKRVTMYRGTTRPDMANDCPEPLFDREFIRYIWRFHRDVRPGMLALLSQFQGREGGTVVHLKSSNAAESWLADVESGLARGPDERTPTGGP
jgi:adenylate kinase family enzyme